MSEVTIKQLADDVRIPVDRLLTQLAEAGIDKKSENDVISEEEKVELLAFLRKSHGKDSESKGDAPKKITLKRRTVSELRQTGTPGGRAPTRGANTRGAAKTVSVEVRRKRTYVKRDTLSEDAEINVQEAEEAKKAAEKPKETKAPAKEKDVKPAPDKAAPAKPAEKKVEEKKEAPKPAAEKPEVKKEEPKAEKPKEAPAAEKKPEAPKAEAKKEEPAPKKEPSEKNEVA